MNTLFIKVDPINPEPEIIAQAGEIIRNGGLVAFPTETVYGLAADAFNEAAVRRVFEVKGRPENKPLPVQVASHYNIDRLTSKIPDGVTILIDAYFPGPLTIILPASECLSKLVTAETGTVGIRMPDHPVALALLRAVGTPIVAPSANPSGEPSPTTAQEVYEYLNGSIDMVLDAGPSQLKTASTVVDMTSGKPRILRVGSISEDELITTLSEVTST